ncbi:MAG: protein phosphatase 2C domain-containing protein [Acidimicrobiales bacterium]
MTACPRCGERSPGGTSWCEACGADLSQPGSASAADEPPQPGSQTTPDCPVCGSVGRTEDGACDNCGRPDPDARNRVEAVDGPVAAVSDRGRRHPHNEDAFAVGTVDGVAVLVVCDGVSSTPGSATASQGAANAARDRLVALLRGDAPPPDDDPVDPGARQPGPAGVAGPAADLDPVASIADAVAVAQGVAADTVASAEDIRTARYGFDGPPSSTLVAAVVDPTRAAPGTSARITVGWVGDSRVYWVSDTDTMLLTVDHEIGGSLSRWLGADSIDPLPDVAEIDVVGPGLVIACSDGLWRYADGAHDMAQLVRNGTGAGELDLARSMVDHANAGGGHDNITVALMPIPGPQGAQ